MHKPSAGNILDRAGLRPLIPDFYLRAESVFISGMGTLIYLRSVRVKQIVIRRTIFQDGYVPEHHRFRDKPRNQPNENVPE
jgi:hypothetical protein